MYRTNSLIFHVAVLLAVTVASATSYAAEDPEALIRDGIELRRHGEDAKAHGYFQRAYEVTHTPRAAAQLALVNQALGLYLEAEHHLTEALETQDPWVLSHRGILEKSRQTVRAHLGKIELRGLPSGATVAWAGQAAQPVPSNNVLWVTPGKLILTFAAPAHSAVTKDTSIDMGQSVSLSVELPPTPPAAVAQPAPAPENAPVAARPNPSTPADEGNASRKPIRMAGLITAGAGVAAGVAGIFVYHAGVTKKDAIERDANGPTPTYDDANGNYQTLGNIGVGLMVGGGIALATGVALYVVGRRADGETGDNGTHVSFAYAPGFGGRLSLGGAF
jgi:hypothetical protein